MTALSPTTASREPVGTLGHPMVDQLLAELRERACATGDAREVHLVETHISWVLVGPEVYKIKKPLVLPFLDFSTLELREKACQNEMRINLRLAPRTYFDVVPVRQSADGTHSFDGDGEIVDWAVKMRRLDDEQRADVLLEHGELDREYVDALARALAAFHADAPNGPRVASCGAPELIEANLTANFAVLKEAGLGIVSDEALAEVERWQLSFVRGHRELFEERIARGAIRDGHGDLRLEHVFFEEGHDDFQIIDGIEFDDRYRFGDVCADVAFLAMDLARLGHVDLAERFLATYSQSANDFDLYRLVDFYESYRACVRAKIAASSASRPDTTFLEIERARAEARRYLLLAEAAHRRSVLDPVLVVVAGGIASGKSTIAGRLGDALGAPVVDTDRTRKFMIGLAPNTHAQARPWEGAYVPSFSNAVYAEMFRRARAVLASGRSVVLEASFRTAAMRAAARELASEHNVRFRILECVAPDEVRRARLVTRGRTPNPSDATVEVFDAFAAGWEPFAELCPTEYERVDTSGAIDASVAAAMRAVEVWPRGLVQ
jgi:uncharacterized protein